MSGARRSTYPRWIQIDKKHAVSEFEAQLFGWKKPRRFVVVRELVRDTKEAVGRKLLDVPGFAFRIFVTNRLEDALVLWRDYNQRAVFEERKAKLNADGFYLKQFFATEAAFLSVLFVFNFLSLYRKALNPHAPYRQPATLRSAVFLGSAALERVGRDLVLQISSAWGGFEKHYPP
jgi:hypothetical protein